MAAPSFERWRELMRFVPAEDFYQRHRNSIRYLRKRGIDGNILFQCAAHPGLSVDAIALVEEGEVGVEAIVARGQDSPAWATFAGLAAQASFLAGDMLGTIRFLRESIAHGDDLCSPWPHIFWIRERASEEEQGALDRAGIPRCTGEGDEGEDEEE